MLPADIPKLYQKCTSNAYFGPVRLLHGQIAYNNLARAPSGACLEVVGQNADALAFYERAHEIFKDTLGVNHPRTYVAKRNITTLRHKPFEIAAPFTRALNAIPKDDSKKKKKKKGKKGKKKR
jgi:hypothetical protein